MAGYMERLVSGWAANITGKTGPYADLPMLVRIREIQGKMEKLNEQELSDCTQFATDTRIGYLTDVDRRIREGNPLSAEDRALEIGYQVGHEIVLRLLVQEIANRPIRARIGRKR